MTKIQSGIVYPDDEGSKHLWTSVNFYQTTRRYIPEDSHL
jgi:hypothetical protein